MRRPRAAALIIGLYVAGVVLAIVVVACTHPVQAQNIPEAAHQYRADMLRSAWRVFGPDAPTATLAGQIHAESAWRIDARSPVGAEGLAQFMPATAADMARRFPGVCAPANPYSARWAFRCRDLYMQSQLRNTTSTGSGLSECARWVFALRRYNGGAGWIIKDRRLASAHGADSDNPTDVAQFNAGRSAAAFRENTEYAPKIIRLQNLYISAGWGRGVECDA